MSARDTLEEARAALERRPALARWLPIPPSIGHLLHRAQAATMAKAAGHKYVRRVANPNPPPRWRYYYKATGEVRGHEFGPGSKFKIAHEGVEGHFEVVGEADGKLRVRHDETGHVELVTEAALRAMLHREHAEVIDAHRGRLRRDLKAVQKYGTERQRQRLEDEARRHGHEDLLEPEDGSGEPTPGADLVLVGCVAKKVEHDDRVPVRDLYTSILWGLRRRYAEAREHAHGVPWGIVSAGLGVADPDRKVRRYEATAADLKGEARARWLAKVRTTLAGQLWRGQAPTPKVVEVLAGADYVALLREAVEGLPVRVVNPIQGYGIGKRQGWMKAQTAKILEDAPTLADRARAENPGRPNWHDRLGDRAVTEADHSAEAQAHEDALEVARRITDLRQGTDGWHFAAAAARATGEPLLDYNGHPVELEDEDGDGWADVEPDELGTWFGRPDWTPEQAGRAFNLAGKLAAYLPDAAAYGERAPSWAPALVHEALADEISPPPSGLRLALVSKGEAKAFIARHHSAMPDWNPRGLVYALGVRDKRGRLVAVATANTPGARSFYTSPRTLEDGRTVAGDNVLEITRIASDGTTKGAASMLAARLIKLAAAHKRGQPFDPHLVVTYSLTSEEGATYKGLRDLGLRPVEFVAVGDKARTGPRIKGGNLDRNAAAHLPKIRWEAGDGAGPARWDLLEAVQTRRKPQQLELLREAERHEIPLEGFFASGSNRAAEIEGFTDLGVNIGVAAPDVLESWKSSRPALAQAAADGRAVFVDSGAVREVKFTPKGPVTVRPISGAEWRRRLDLYHEIADIYGPRMSAVLPDKVGDQAETLARMRTYRADAERLRATGARLLAPIQSSPGGMGLEAFDDAVGKALGFRDYVPAFPMRNGATDLHALEAYLRARRPKSIHLLGIGQKSATWPKVRDAIMRAAPDTHVTFDANRIAAASGRTGGKGGGPRKLTAAEDRVRERAADEAFLGSLEHAPDYTDFIAEPSAWTTPAMRRRLWDTFGDAPGRLGRAKALEAQAKATARKPGLSDEQRAAAKRAAARVRDHVRALRADRERFAEDPEGWLQDPQLRDNGNTTGSPAYMQLEVDHALDGAWRAWFEGAGTASTRRRLGIRDAFEGEFKP